MYELEDVKRTSLFFSALKLPVRRKLVKMAENPSSFKKLYENLGNYGIELKYMSSLHRQVATLVEADLLEKYHDGTRYLYRSKLKQAALDLGTMKIEFENTDGFPTEVLDENKSGLVLEALGTRSRRDIIVSRFCLRSSPELQ